MPMVCPSRVCPAPLARRRPTLAALALLLATAGASVQAGSEVQARLSTQTVAQGQPVELDLEARGDDLEAPDLGVLETDFHILDRRVSRQVSVRNGQRSSQVRLGLLLLPKRNGDLTVPAIRFGQASSEPLSLTVEAGAAGADASAWSMSLPPGGEPVPAPEMAWPGGFASPIQEPQGVSPDRVPRTPIDLSPEPEHPAPAPRERADEAGGVGSNPWFWISLGLGAALVGLLLSRRRTAAAPTRAAEMAAEPSPPSPAELALHRVRLAYDEGDAAAAREALLAWARLRWPEDPPGNLARLAQRCPPRLREHVTRLEMAFFSPTPVAWASEAALADMAELAGTPTDPRSAQLPPGGDVGPSP